MGAPKILTEQQLGYSSTQAGRVQRFATSNLWYVDLGNGTFAGPFNSQGEAQTYGQTVAAGNTAQSQAPINSLVQDAQNSLYGPGPEADAAASALFGVAPGTVVTHGGQQIAGPGELQQAADRNAQIRAELAGNTTGFINANNATLGAFGGSVGDYDTAIDGLSLPASVAAQAKADPATIAAELQSLGLLQGAANGSLDVHSDPTDVARQSQAEDKLWSLSDPQVTAQERYLMEVARAAEERDTRAGMDAALRNLSARGQLGSGAEVGAQLGVGQHVSQNRMQQDLGTQAGAVQRAMQALGLYSNLATSMRNASDAIAAGNSNRRESAMEGAGNLASNARSQSFNEQFQTGTAADQNAAAQTALAKNKADSKLAAAGALKDTGLAVNGANFTAQTQLAGFDQSQADEAYARSEAARQYIDALKRLGISTSIEGAQEKNVWGT